MALGGNNINQTVKKNQYILGGTVLTVITFAVAGIYGTNKYFANKKLAEQPTFEEESAELKPDLTGQGSISNTFSGTVAGQVMTDSQAQAKENREALKKVLEKLEDMEAKLDSTQKENEELRQELAESKKAQEEVFDAMNQMREQGVNNQPDPVIVSNGQNANRSPLNYSQPTNQNYSQQGGVVKLSNGGVNGAFERKTYAKKGQGGSSRFYVPSGAFSNAIVLEGADANAAVTSQANNNSPMQFKLTGELHLPMNKRSGQLKGCFVTAGAYGDISSERAIVRLKRLSCVINGKHIDQEVQGHVAFYGKNGIKGVPVMRNGKMLGLAFASGALGGIGNAASRIGDTQVGIGATNTISGADVLREAAGGGTQSAANKLADYYIQRAEQYHPVIPIGAANRVEVVFQEGFFAEFVEDIEAEKNAANGSVPMQEQNNVGVSNLPTDLQNQLGQITKGKLSDFVTPNQK